MSPPRLVVGERPLVEVVRWAQGVLGARPSDAAAANGAAAPSGAAAEPGAAGAPAVRPTEPALELLVPDPDAGRTCWPGERRPDGAPQRSWRAWVDLAAGLGCVLGTPAPVGDGTVRVALWPLGDEAPWHGAPTAAAERYTEATGFDAVHKLEDPGFLLPLLEAFERVRPPDGGRVLVLGCHRGDEVAALGLLEPPPNGLDVVGVDHAPGPLAQARARFPTARFVLGDVASLDPALGRFDLVVAVAVLQSRGVDDRALLRRVVQAHVGEAGALVLGVPASRFRAHDVVWGARTRNYREPDLSLAVQDLAVYRRYLHQHRFRTHVGGRYDLLLSAWRGR